MRGAARPPHLPAMRRGRTGGGRWPVSQGGGNLPRWRRDGKELFYLTGGSGRLMAVAVTLSPGFQAGIPKQLFQFPPGAVRPYDVTSDGQKFISFATEAATSNTPPSAITVVLNWQAGLKK